ncbi:NAD-dependent epimerase/dehydratase family protein [Pseudactinotalea sp. Z1739]|uniref:NAD-dependent epimerase/dehydratase family protein n=1 Tax=Pseudactinotalea sp. Z1739 TaxID=3413028 RepID=UPI003C7D1C4B
MRIAVLGASGFVGSAVRAAARHAGHHVIEVPAPRLTTAARGTDAVHAQAMMADDDAATLADRLTEAQVVINAAGLATPGAGMTDAVVGANALLPGVVVRAAALAGAERVVHVSSAAVHGEARVLDPAAQPRPASPYGWSKLWGEQVASAAVLQSPPTPGAGQPERGAGQPDHGVGQPDRRPRRGDHGASGPTVVTYRPTSVHGPGRSVTDQVRRLARSPLACVAAPGDDPTPQVMVEQVAAHALHLATAPEVPTGPVIHPWEGWTTSSFLQHLGDGRRPRRIPRPLARAALAVAKTAGRLHPRLGANARRLEMLWFGQRQKPT